MTGAPKRVCVSLLRAAGRLAIGASVVSAVVLVPVISNSSGVDARGSRGRLTIVVVGDKQNRSACVTLRDLTENFVVGTYCDGDWADLNRRIGRIELDLPQRSFAIDARISGASISSISPKHFELRSRQSIVVRVERD
jgi:hypothetical protein